ncbi:DUF4185 domain-containing protein [Nannocystis bainbridge]|uniref:DUF4185 domain-containing protein n=1 Tax=Nannocystis bainbridge TaxID=2995303 RepID=A0ABT5E1J5_9BACT|nr:DUF4185 domain-containing protein [Nannocystis bainbridge]MDC0719199.1 DUF4185 domain-containing protein [Nannocystis bainbridge]
MPRLFAPALVIASCLFSSPAWAVQTDTELVCLLVGKDYHNGTDPTSAHQPDLRLFGTDLGFSFRHDDSVVMLFGDTWIEEDFICEPPSFTDDSLAFIDLAEDDDPEDCLDLVFPTDLADVPLPIEVWQSGVLQNMGPLRTPLTGFSDGRQLYGMFTGDAQTCLAAPVCPEGLTCVGGLCGDATSSQAGFGTLAFRVKIASATSSNPTVFNVGHEWPTNKFVNPTSRAIGALDERDPDNNDYEPGEEPDELLVWGRPGFAAAGTGTADLYLLHHPLSTLNGPGTTINWTPRYFAGMSGSVPTWSSTQTDAVPVIALEDVDPVLHSSVAYVPAIQKWVLLYSGRWPGTASTPTTGVYMRTAPHPWGPWSEADLIWHAVDDGAYDCPGGFMYDEESVGMSCTPTDPYRPGAFEACPAESADPNGDLGVEYGINILDTFTASGMAIDTATIYWNLSTWNPYRVVLMKTDLDDSVIIPP